MQDQQTGMGMQPPKALAESPGNRKVLVISLFTVLGIVVGVFLGMFVFTDRDKIYTEIDLRSSISAREAELKEQLELSHLNDLNFFSGKILSVSDGVMEIEFQGNDQGRLSVVFNEQTSLEIFDSQFQDETNTVPAQIEAFQPEDTVTVDLEGSINNKTQVYAKRILKL